MMMSQAKADHIERLRHRMRLRELQLKAHKRHARENKARNKIKPGKLLVPTPPP